MPDSPDPAEEIAAILDRARGSLDAAQQLDEGGHHDYAVSRAYYAVFYAASAALRWKGLEFGRHSGVIAAFHREFVRAGIFDASVGRTLNLLFELRTIGDYGETRHVPAEDAVQALASAAAFVTAVETFLSSTR